MIDTENEVVGDFTYVSTLVMHFVVFISITTTTHYGTKPGHFETSKIHFLTSEGVSEVSGASK